MSLEGHPGLDILTSAAAIVLADRAVVPLSRALADIAAICATTPRQLHVVTPTTARLTPPLEALLRTRGVSWVVRDDDAGHRDGLRGTALDWDGERFVPRAGLAAEPPPPSDAGDATGGCVLVDVRVTHPARAGGELGGVVEDCFAILTGSPPAGWGVAEPAAGQWNREALTRLCRTRAPAPSTLVVTGGTAAAPAVGTVEVRRTAAGVQERLRLVVGCPQAPELAFVDRLAEHVASAYDVRSMLVGLRAGRADATVGCFPLPALPHGLLLGADDTAAAGIEHSMAAPVSSACLVGPDRRPSSWLLLTGADAAPHLAFSATLRHFGLTEVA